MKAGGLGTGARVPANWFARDQLTGMVPKPDLSEPAVDPKCGTCAACCWFEMVYVMDHETGYDTESMVSPIDGAVLRVLRHNPDGSCVYLKDGKCSIYELRPACCRGFDCGGWYRRMAATRPGVLKDLIKRGGQLKKMVKQGRARA